MSGARLAIFSFLLSAAYANNSIKLCGHESNASSDCAPVTPGVLFIAIAPFTFFPFLIFWAMSCYCCLKEQDVEMDFGRCWRRGGDVGTPGSQVPMISPPITTPNAASLSMVSPGSQGPNSTTATGRADPHIGLTVLPSSVAQPRTPRGRSPAAGGNWQCPQCTYSNKASVPVCDMCSAPHSVS